MSILIAVMMFVSPAYDARIVNRVIYAVGRVPTNEPSYPSSALPQHSYETFK